MRTLVLLLLVVLVSPGCGGSHRSDDQLERLFLDHEEAFEQLADMLHEDDREIVIYADDSAESRCDVSAARRAEYEDLLEGIDARCLWYFPKQEGDFRIQMSFVNEGGFLDYSDKGFVWRETPPDPGDLSDDLNRIPPDQPETFKSIKGKWYLYTERGD